MTRLSAVLTVVVTLASVGSADATDPGGRWSNSPDKEWFENLRLPAGASCCGLGDAHLTDEWTVDPKTGDARVRVTTPSGARFDFVVPADHVLLKSGWSNPTGRGVLFASPDMRTAYCFVPAAQS